MSQQPFVGSRELLRVTQVIHRGAHPVRPMLERNTAQLPKRILQSLTQALEGFRVTDRSCFPVRVGQNEVIDQMRKRLPVDRDAQLPAMREVRLTQLTRPMLLGKEHFARRPFRCPPVLDPAPQCPHLSILEPPGIRSLQMLKQRLSLQTWLGSSATAESLPTYPQTDPAAFATYAFVASRSAVVDPAGISALFSGPSPPSLPRLPATTSVSVATAASPADRSPYKSSSTCIVLALLCPGILIVPAGILIVRDQVCLGRPRDVGKDRPESTFECLQIHAGRRCCRAPERRRREASSSQSRIRGREFRTLRFPTSSIVFIAWKA